MTKRKNILAHSVRKFLAQPRTARLATLGRDGYPHVVPIWFMRDGDDIIFGSDDREQKVVNAVRHPKAAVVIGGEPEQDDAGYLIQGDARIERREIDRLLKKLWRRYDAEDESDEEWERGARVLIRLKPRKVIRVW